MNTLQYWDARYKDGTGVGAGSKGDLYAFKLETVQDLVKKYKVASVVDYGCGDGSQLAELKVKEYLGLDISREAILRAQASVEKHDFLVVHEDGKPIDIEDCKRDMAVSLDVIPHLPGGEFEAYMENLFALAEKYVLIYAPNRAPDGLRLESHMHFRRFTDWIEANTEAEQIEHIENRYPAEEPGPGVSYCEFFLFKL